jgi:hypothetical protein
MEVREAGFPRRVERLAVHERDHQDLAARGILRDRGQEARGIEFGQEFTALLARRGVAGSVRNWCYPLARWAANPRADWSLLHDNHRARAKSMLRCEATL